MIIITLFKSYDSSVLVNGESILAVTEGMGAFKRIALKILEDNNIPEPQPGNWYKLQDYLNAFKIISDKLGNATLEVIGKKIPETAVLPPDLDTIEKALTMMDAAYHMNYKNGEIGHYAFEKKGNSDGIMTCNNPYPCAYDKGIILGFMYRLRTRNSIPSVEHVEGSCRMNGAEECKYKVAW